MSLFDNVGIKDLAKLLKNSDPNSHESGGSSDEAEDEIQGSKAVTVTRVLGPSDIGGSSSRRKVQGGSAETDESRDQHKSSATASEAETETMTAQNSASSSSQSRARPQESKSKIWSEHELKAKSKAGLQDVGPDVSLDPREVPTYEMYFSQSVTSEDVYLQMGHKTPATASCESLIVKISLPGEDHSSMQLELKEQRVELRSPTYILSLPTPHRIDPRAGNAKWNPDTETLVLTLKLDRDLDMFNL